jgi:hypothetical protein
MPDPARRAPTRDTLLVAPFDLAAIAGQLAAHRGVPMQSAVPLTSVDELAWTARFGAATSTGRSDGLLYPFGVAPPGGPSAALPAQFARGLAGLYDRRTKAIWIRSHDDRPEGTRAWTMVHEFEHALQDQSSKLRIAPRGADEALAFRAAIEGDAEITTAAFVASRGLSLDHWLARLLAHVKTPAAGQDGFGDAPEFIRRQWVFPYVDGTLFVGALYRAGGYPLVDRMFQSPPVSTEQVLHPEKYLAGELPVPVPVPDPPEGRTLKAAGHMGELRIGALLSPCEGPSIEDTLSGWGGDSYAILTDAGQGLAVLWSSVWDDVASAQHFEDLARSRDACARARLGGSIAPQPATVVRDGDRVAYVLGLPADASAATARALLAVPLTRSAADPPLGPVRLRPLADPGSFVGKGSMRGGRYVSDPLGLSLSVQGFDVVATTDDAEVTLEEWFGMTALRLNVSAVMSAWTPALEQRMAWEMMGADEAAGLLVVYLGDAAIATGAGPGRALRWSRGEGTGAALVLVPVCSGKITLVMAAGGGGPRVWEEIQRVARRLRFDSASPACRFATEDGPSESASIETSQRAGAGQTPVP